MTGLKKFNFTIDLILIIFLSLIAYSCSTNFPKAKSTVQAPDTNANNQKSITANADDHLQQYGGEYIYEQELN